MLKLRKSNEAVSPVIGVILMVAITVVLAAVVFVLVTNLSGSVHEVRSLSIAYKESDHSFTLIESPSNSVTYADLTVKDNGITQTFTVNGASPVSTAKISAGDLVKISGMTTGSHDISFVINGQVVYSKSFAV